MNILWIMLLVFCKDSLNEREREGERNRKGKDSDDNDNDDGSDDDFTIHKLCDDCHEKDS